MSIFDETPSPAPLSLKVGQVFTGFGVGCGFGLGVGRSAGFLRSLPLGAEVASAAGQLNHSLTGISYPLLSLVSEVGWLEGS